MITSSHLLPNTLIISAYMMSSRQASHTSIRWVFDCSQWTLTPTIWFKCLKSIQPEERERINRFVFQNDAISSMVGRLLMRKLVVESTQPMTTWRDVKLGRSENGKPYVKNKADVAMNVSHHGRMTVLAAEVFHWGRQKEDSEELRKNEEVLRREEEEDRRNTVEEQSKRLDHDEHDQCKSVPKLEMESISNSRHLKTKTQSISSEMQASEENQDLQLSEMTIKTDTKERAPQDQNCHTLNQAPKLADQMLSNSTCGDCQQVPGYSLQLGVDVCKRDLPRNTPVPEFFRIMRRNFHPAEWDYILAGSGEQDQLGRFYRMWSLKESFVKATGTGITVPLAEMCFLPVTEPLPGHCVYDTRVRVQEVERREWLFEETLLEGGYCVAVALRRGDKTGGGVDKGVFCVDKVYEIVRFDDLEPLMPDVVEDDDEEIFYEAQDFIKKQLRPWDS